MQFNVKALTNSLIGLLIVTFVILLIVLIQPKKIKHPDRPDFTSLQAGAERKAVFFEYMEHLVSHNNNEISEVRKTLQSYQSELDDLWWFEKEYVLKIASHYGMEFFDINNPADWRTLLERVDIVPVSLALAQAANESAWGTSRFALEGNNYFGQWCYKKGCGFVPAARNAGAIHEVAKFDAPISSVESYTHNINTHSAYKLLREIRAKLRERDNKLTGTALADGLVFYSEKRQVYVDEIKNMIRSNKLEVLD